MVEPAPGGTFGLRWAGMGALFQRWTLRNLGTPAMIRLEVAGAGHTNCAVSAATWIFVGATQSGSNLNSRIVDFDGSSQAVPVSATLNTQGNSSRGRQIAVAVPIVAAFGLLCDRALAPAEVEQNREMLPAAPAVLGANSLTKAYRVRYAVLYRAQQLEEVMESALLETDEERAATHSVRAGSAARPPYRPSGSALTSAGADR